MKKNIDSLGNDMGNILLSTQEVVKFNDKITEHAQSLSASTEEVNAFTEEALVMMEDNKNKTSEARKLIQGLVDISNELVQE